LVCTNGLIKGDETSRISVYHKNQDDLEAIIRASFKIVEMGQEIMGQVGQMKQIMLNEQERLLLAKYAMMARFDIEPEIDEETW
jgi:spore coat protein CotH